MIHAQTGHANEETSMTGETRFSLLAELCRELEIETKRKRKAELVGRFLARRYGKLFSVDALRVPRVAKAPQ